MKIAMVAPVEETIPPRMYGGTEWIIYQLAFNLGKKHQVDLFTSEDTPFSPNYQVIPVTKRSLRTDKIASSNLKYRESSKLLSIAKTVELVRKNNYDIIHNHASWRFLTFANLFDKPVVTTHHGPLNLSYQNLVFQNYKDTGHISISNNQRKDFPNLNFISTIYNGIIIENFPFLEYSEAHESHPFILFLARMSEEKGAIEAVQAAVESEKNIVVAAKIDEVNKQYFEDFKKKSESDFVKFVGEIAQDKKIEYLQNARVLLAPIQWEEPFGLMFTEAMACGTPVIAFSRGSAPEIIKDGETGFLVNQSDKFIRGDFIIKKTGVEGLREAIDRIYSMPKEDYIKMRHASRKQVEENFTTEKMVEEYEKAYEKLISNIS